MLLIFFIKLQNKEDLGRSLEGSTFSSMEVINDNISPIFIAGITDVSSGSRKTFKLKCQFCILTHLSYVAPQGLEPH